jgi:hypothetical protein
MALAVTTRSFGMRIADVVWTPEEKWPEIDLDAPLPSVPDPCIEVFADDNDADQVERKADAYLNSGAQEVIIVGPFGNGEFQGLDGPACVIVVSRDPPTSRFSGGFSPFDYRLECGVLSFFSARRRN